MSLPGGVPGPSERVILAPVSALTQREDCGVCVWAWAGTTTLWRPQAVLTPGQQGRVCCNHFLKAIHLKVKLKVEIHSTKILNKRNIFLSYINIKKKGFLLFVTRDWISFWQQLVVCTKITKYKYLSRLCYRLSDLPRHLDTKT